MRCHNLAKMKIYGCKTFVDQKRKKRNKRNMIIVMHVWMQALTYMLVTENFMPVECLQTTSKP